MASVPIINDTKLPWATSAPTSSSLQSAIIATLSIYAVISVIANAFCLAIIYATPSLYTINNILLANMALSDLISGTIAIPASIAVVSFTSDHEVPPTLCQFQGFAIIYLYGVSLMTATAVTVDRFLAVVKPLHYSGIITPKLRWFIGLIWLSPLPMASMPLMHLEHIGFGNFTKVMICWIDLHRDQLPYVFSVLLLIFIIGIIIAIIICYFWIFIIACRKTTNTFQGSSKDIKRSIRTTAIIIGTSILCWIPLVVYFTIDISRGIQSMQLSVVEVIIYLAAISNSMINPIVYISTNHILRKKFCHLFKFFPSKSNRIHSFMG